LPIAPVPSYTISLGTVTFDGIFDGTFEISAKTAKKYRHIEGEVMALSDIKAKAAKVPEGKKQVKLADSGGMYLLVKPKGKYWRLDYRFNGKRKTLALGTYPSISLKQARAKRDKAKKEIEQGFDPSTEKQLAKHFNVENFEGVAREWFNKFSPNWSPAYQHKIICIISSSFTNICPLPGVCLAYYKCVRWVGKSGVRTLCQC